MSDNAQVAEKNIKKKSDDVGSDPDSPAENRRKNAYESEDNSED
jgi:hypothetical protein